MQFEAPKQSIAHQALIREAQKAALDSMSLRRLLWLVNAHPELIGHGRIFGQMFWHLQSVSFQTSSLAWAGDWKLELPTWIDLCRWIFGHRHQLELLPELMSFNRHIENKHPLVGEGVERHGVPAALWNSHETCKQLPISEQESTQSAVGYFNLQCHLLASYIDCRFRMSTLDFYESYSDEPERPIAPSHTGAVGLAIRSLSEAKYAQYMIDLPVSESTVDFAKKFRLKPSLAQGLDWEVVEDAERYFASLSRYFRRFLRVLSGWKPPQMRMRGWGGGGKGGHAWRHGFIQIPGPKGVYFENKTITTDEDDDLPGSVAFNVLIDLDTEYTNDPITVEGSGLAPSETLEYVFRFYSPDELKGRHHAARNRRLAAEANAQSLTFDYSKLTPQELRDINKHASSIIARYLSGSSQERQTKLEAIGGLIVRIMLCLGQPIGQARTLRCNWIVNTLSGVAVEPSHDHLALMVTAPVKGDWKNARVAGFRIPGIMPAYRSQLAEELADIDRESVNSFVLPDVLGLGQQLLTYMQFESSPDLNGFGIKENTANFAVDALLQSFQDVRITKGKVSRTLQDIINQQTGDQTLSWVVTGDSRQSNQPRMHYTRYTVDTLVSAYGLAARRLAKWMGIRLTTNTPTTTALSSQASVGARFVIELPEVQDMVKRLLNLLNERYQASLTDRQVRRYHSLFLLYTALYQSILTSIRAISAPSAVYLAWHESNRCPGDVLAPISDKDSKYSDRTRLVPILPALAEQFGHYKVHRQMLTSRLSLIDPWLSALGEAVPFFVITPEYQIESLTPAWMKAALKEFTGHDIPSNFHRAFLRTELLARGCTPEIIDAHLGHANFGEVPHSKLSTFDYGLHFSHLQTSLQGLHDDLGLKPVASRLIPRKVRIAV